MSLYIGNTKIPQVKVTTGNIYTFDDIATNSYTETDIILSTATYIMPHAFAGMTSLRSISGPNVTAFSSTKSNSRGDYTFYNCTNLTSINFPKLSNPGNGGYQFYKCTGLTSVYLPLVVTGTHMFDSCSNLQIAVIGVKRTSADQLNGYGFINCKKLTTADIHTSRVYTQEFYNATVLNTLILRQNSVAALSNINAFSGTPFASGKTGGTLYVPESLIASYQSASNWSTILGYTNNQIKSIESTHTDVTAPIDLTLYYADGTAI